jgi:hypothetical protein
MASLPTADIVADTLSKMLRRTVRAKTTPAKASLAKLAGLYRSKDDTPVAACMTDIPFAAYSGAAFSMIPADAAKDSIKAGALDEGMQDNFAEVLNMLSRLFADQGNHRIALQAKSFPPAALPELASKALSGGGKKLDLEIDIDGYGKGLLMLRVI